MGFDISEIRTRYDKGYYTYKDPAGRDKMKLPENYIFDENLTVKQNREMVIKHNDEVEQFKRLKQAKQADLNRQLTEDVVTYIKENYNLSLAQAVIVERFTYENKHAFMSDYFSYIDTFAIFAEELNNSRLVTN